MKHLLFEKLLANVAYAFLLLFEPGLAFSEAFVVPVLWEKPVVPKFGLAQSRAHGFGFGPQVFGRRCF